MKLRIKNNILMGMVMAMIFNIGAFAQENRNYPQEYIYIHQNSTLLFPGERIYFTVFNINAETKALSNLSKTAYVQIVDSNLDQVLYKKIKLEEGKGEGDFFLPSNLQTGTYKIIGYTQWMSNQDPSSFFKNDLRIINPYQIVPEQHQPKMLDSLKPIGKLAVNTYDNPDINENQQSIDIEVSKEELSTRENFSLQINLDQRLSNKNAVVSVSVRKLNELESPSSNRLTEYYNRSIASTKDNLILNPRVLPELRGEIISGQISYQDDSAFDSNPVSLSFPGDDYRYYVSTTDKNGNFTFIVDESYTDTQANVDVHNDNIINFTVSLNKDKIDLGAIDFPGFQLNENDLDIIKNRSIEVQLKNAYDEVTEDSTENNNRIKPFYHQLPYVYHLDDFTRFSSIPETVVEILEHVSIQRQNDTVYRFKVRPNVGLPNPELKALVFVDGMFIKQHEKILTLDARNIETVRFSRDSYQFGPLRFEGILAFETIQGNYFKFFQNANANTVQLLPYIPVKEIFTPNYNSLNPELRANIPDLRRQLFWELLNISEDTKINLSSSDIEGTYEIVVEGFVDNNIPVSKKTFIKVSKKLQ